MQEHKVGEKCCGIAEVSHAAHYLNLQPLLIESEQENIHRICNHPEIRSRSKVTEDGK